MNRTVRERSGLGDCHWLCGRDLALRERGGRQSSREREREQRRERDRAEGESQRVELRVAIVVGDRASLVRREATVHRRLLDGRDGHDVDPLLDVRDDRLARGDRDVGVGGDALAEAGRERPSKTAPMIAVPSEDPRFWAVPWSPPASLVCVGATEDMITFPSWDASSPRRRR
jgi:hypothetical protein